MKRIQYKEYSTRSGVSYVAPKHIMDKIFSAGFKVNICGKKGHKSLQVFSRENGKKRYIGMLSHFIKCPNFDEYVTFNDNNQFNLRVSNLKVNQYDLNA